MELKNLKRATPANWHRELLLIALLFGGVVTSGRCQVLFSDAFSRTTLPPWVAQAGTWTVGGGVLSGTNTAQSFGWAYITNSFSNYAVQARIRFTSTSAVGGGLGARWNPVVGSHYAAWVYPDNSVVGQSILRLIKYQDYSGAWEYNNVTAVPMAQVSLAPVGTNWHTLNIAVQGNQIRVSYDSNQVVSVVDTESNPYLTGAIGVGIATDSNPYSFLVDDVTVTALPPALMAVNDLYVVGQGGSLNVPAPGVLGNDTAVAKTNFTATLVNAPTRGALTFNSNGSFTYVPSNGVVGMDAFTYRASDGFSNSGLATVSIDVTPSTNAFYDDFSRPANGSSAFAPWVTGLGEWSVSGGSLLGTASQANDYSGCFVPTNFGDFTVQTKFQLPAGAWACGLIGRLDTNTGASYVANVYPEGSGLGPTPALRLIKFHSWTTWSPTFTPMALVPLPPVGTSTHTLRMTFQGNLIDVYFDGAQIVHMADTNVDGIAPFLSGAAGAHMYMDTAFTATFDDFSISPIVGSNAPPVITSQPVSRTNSAGTTATFTVGASGVSLSYQWQKGTAPINGATNATLTLNSVSDPNAGSYRAIVSNPYGSATSAVATLTIINPPVIVTQPASQTNNVGSNVTFTVSVNGTSPAFQWRKNGANLANGGNVSGATTSALSLANIVAGDAGNYTVVITNSAGSVTSAVATLTVAAAPPVITSQPVSRTNSAGTTATFTVGATGAGLLYQWQKGAAPINGGTNATLTLPSVSDPDAGSYRAIVSNPYGSVTSAVATLTIINPPVIVTQPASQTNNVGSNVTFTVSVNGTSPAFQWRKNGANLANGGNVSGATTSALSLANIATGDAGNYTVVVTNAAGSVTSAVAILTVVGPPLITSQPVSRTNSTGTTATFAVGASGTGLLYQWQKGVAPIDGGTNATLTLSSVSASDAGSYSAVVSNPYGSVTSSVVTLTIIDGLAIVTQPVSQTTNVGSTVSFNVIVSGTSPAYQWRKNGTNVTDAGRISGATTATLTMTNIAASDAGSYTVVVTNSGSSLTSSVATLTVIVPPVITSQPASRTNNAGTTATFTVGASGIGLLYQWQKGTAPIGGATNATLTLNSVSDPDAGSYRAIVSNSVGTVTSAVATLTIINPPGIVTQPASRTNDAGTTASFSVTVSGTSPVFQWRKNGTNITNGGNVSGATTSALALANVGTGDAAAYAVVVTNAAGSVTSSPAFLTVISTNPPWRLFADDFSRSTEPGSLSPWGLSQSDDWTISAGVLSGTPKGQGYGNLYVTNVWTNYAVQAQVRFSAGSYGGGLGAYDNGSGGTRYAAWIFPEGSSGGANTLKLLKYKNWKSSIYTMQQTNLPSVGTNWHTLTLAMFGNRAAAFYDGVQMLNTVDTDTPVLTGGGVTIDLLAPDSSNAMSVDNVVVNSITGVSPFEVLSTYAPMIQAVARTNGSATVRWTTWPGMTYRLQYIDSLGSGTWNNATPEILADTGLLTATNAFGSAGQRFYRVLLVK